MEQIMNTLTVIGATLLITTAGFTSQANATEFVAADESIGTQICMAIASNKRTTLKNTMASHKVTHYTIKNKLTCNDMSVATFANTYNLNRTASQLHFDLNTLTSIRDLSARAPKPSTIIVSGSK